MNPLALALVLAPTQSVEAVAALEHAHATLVTTTRGVRVVRPKPPQAELTELEATDVIRVKFHDDLVVREREGALEDRGTGALDGARSTLARFAGGTWRRAHLLPEAKLAALRITAQNNLGKHVADLNQQFDFWLPPGVSAREAIDAFNALDCVEVALTARLPEPTPAFVPPDFSGSQGYQDFAPGGMNVASVWRNPGGTGTYAWVADIEYSYNAAHLELGGVIPLGPAGTDPFGNNNHGTSVLGTIVPPSDGVGVTGSAYGTSAYFFAAYYGAALHIDAAITSALGTVSAGDVILLEQQMSGPNGAGTYVPVEWDINVYNSIVTAVGNGLIVVEAAGNGNQDLDAAIFGQGNNGHWPFKTANDSGAFIVGAGAPPGGSQAARSRLPFSTYGSTVDVQGWGENVATCGTANNAAGNLYSAEGVNARYRADFDGTSSASAVIAGMCSQISSMYYVGSGNHVNPGGLRQVLRLTGAPQEAGVNPVAQNIGPHPNVAAAIQVMLYGSAIPYCPGDGFNVNCPCGNNSPVAAYRGCQNSIGRGALLTAVGGANIFSDTFRLMGTEMPASSALYFQGTLPQNAGIGTLFGDGLRCVTGSVVRLGIVQNAADGSSVMPRPGQESISSRGQITAPGWRYYQIWYRNAAAYCTASTFNLTNAVRVQWGW